MEGVVNGLPDPIELPPVKAENQFIVPDVAVAERETVPAPHLVAGVFPVTIGKEFTVSVAAVELTTAPQAPSRATRYW
jgi:hypothetical protein